MNLKMVADMSADNFLSLREQIKQACAQQDEIERLYPIKERLVCRSNQRDELPFKVHDNAPVEISAVLQPMPMDEASSAAWNAWLDARLTDFAEDLIDLIDGEIGTLVREDVQRQIVSVRGNLSVLQRIVHVQATEIEKGKTDGAACAARECRWHTRNHRAVVLHAD